MPHSTKGQETKDPWSFFELLKRRIVGHRVKYRRLACDSLLLYVECEPGDEKGVTIWFEPV